MNLNNIGWVLGPRMIKFMDPGCKMEFRLFSLKTAFEETKLSGEAHDKNKGDGRV